MNYITSAGKVDFTEFVADSDVVSTYTGEEGDTSKIPDLAALRMLDAKFAGNISNPNLLINPDFKINQRGQTEYVGHGYTSDRWMSRNANTIFEVFNGYVKLSNSEPDASNHYMMQHYDISDAETYTLSCEFRNASGNVYLSDDLSDAAKFDNSVTEWTKKSLTFIGNQKANKDRVVVGFISSLEPTGSVEIRNVKLELGSIATPFVPPDPATELVKCQRYYQVHTTGDISPVDLRPNMRIAPTITQLSNGNYAYDAEIY